MDSKRQKLQMVLETVMAIAVLAVFTGCNSYCKEAFKDNMTDSVSAVQAGQLDQAAELLDSVSDCAKSYKQKRQLESMQELIEGSRAMMNGNATQAKASWSQIRDPQLNREVRIKADSVIGIEVPMIPQEKETD